MRTARHAIAALAVVALATAACTRGADETEIGAAPAPEGQAPADSGGGEAATGSRLDQGGFGELENVCQDGEPGPASDVGLTADEIHLGTVTDKGSAERPGLTQEMYDAAVAFAAWCNEHGGIGGRSVVIDDLDAKLFEYSQRVGEACQQDFALVGELRSVRAAYGPIDVLHGVDLTLGAGEVLAVLGPNGAGKTTLLNVLAGLHPLAGGDVILAGRRVNAASATARARAGLCLIPEGRGVFPNLTVRENLRMAAGAARRRNRADVEAAAYDRFPKLKDRRRQLAGTLSGGEQQMLALARGLATDPAVLVLDELSMGLAPLVVEQLYGQVAGMARAGVSVLVVEQFARVVMGVADRAALLVQGRVAAIGPPGEIESKLSSAYLGG